MDNNLNPVKEALSRMRNILLLSKASGQFSADFAMCVERAIITHDDMQTRLTETLINAAQLFDGWKQTTPPHQWSAFDEKVRTDITDCLLRLQTTVNLPPRTGT